MPTSRSIKHAVLILLLAFCRPSLFEQGRYAEHYLYCLDNSEKSENCSISRQKTVEIIEKALSAQKDVPFGKVMSDAGTRAAIDAILEKDDVMEVRYGILWKEFVR